MINEWQEALISDPKGRIWWLNLQYDLEQCNLAPEVTARFFEAVENILSISAADAPFTVLTSALKEPPFNFSLQGRRTTCAEPVSRVIDSSSFAKYHVKTEELFGIGASDVQDELVWKMFNQGDIDPEKHYQGELRTERSFFWGTLTKRFEDLFAKYNVQCRHCVEPPDAGDVLATEMRNLLGLCLVNEGIGIYRIDIPSEVLEAEGVEVCIPTTLDSSPSCVFFPSDRSTAYGRTLHLGELGPGVEEVVVKAIPFTKELRVTQVGYVRGPLPDDGTVWATLERLIQERFPASAAPGANPQAGS